MFNARLLENFFTVFNEKNRLLVDKLKKVCDTNQVIDLWDYVAPTALEIICGKFSIIFLHEIRKEKNV